VTTVQNVNGTLPFDVRLVFGPNDAATPLAFQVGFGGGRVALLTSGDDIRNKPSRPVHYARLVPYRRRQGLSVERIESGVMQLSNIALDARVRDGVLAADRIAMNVLGGDVLGEMAVQLDRHNRVVGLVDFKTSNIDASNFEGLDLEPGPASELSADINVAMVFGPAERDLAVTMNVTKVGDQAFDRLLQALSDNGKDEKMESYRSQLGLVDIREVAIWMRYENLNMDLDYSAVVPGYSPIPREMLRRFPMSGILDVQLQPYLDRYLAPNLGWPVGGGRGATGG
jgi:hypothetical protein